MASFGCEVKSVVDLPGQINGPAILRRYFPVFEINFPDRHLWLLLVDEFDGVRHPALRALALDLPPFHLLKFFSLRRGGSGGR